MLLRRGFGAQEGVAGERGAERCSEGRILRGELRRMGASIGRFELCEEFMRDFPPFSFWPEHTYPSRTAKIFSGSGPFIGF